MSVIESFGSEYNRLRLLGFSRLEATVLVFFDPVRFSLLMLWRVCVLRPLFMVGVLTVGLWIFLPATQLSEMGNKLIHDDNAMSQFWFFLFLSSAVLEGGRLLRRLRRRLDK
ncbi:hypothetical protein ABMA09_22850 [Erwinia rhapontici]|uniref:hypothetical protein n=1 Tax=Erwinia rhapontici TaxID=55212 RepID=UPI003D36606E